MSSKHMIPEHTPHASNTMRDSCIVGPGKAYLPIAKLSNEGNRELPLFPTHSRVGFGGQVDSVNLDTVKSTSLYPP